MNRDQKVDAILNYISDWADARYAYARESKTFYQPGERMHYLMQGRMDSLDELRFFLSGIQAREDAWQEDRILRHGDSEGTQTGEKE